MAAGRASARTRWSSPVAASAGPRGRTHAWGPPCGTGRIRVQAEDFRVEEDLGFEPSGEGHHAWVELRKTGTNTGWAAEQLARAWGVHPRHVGFAGSKDRYAVTTQWFSLPGDAPEGLAAGASVGEGLEVVTLTRHDRKLRRGWLRGNRFRIRVAGLQADRDCLENRLALIQTAGVPNYFGDQRFGRDGDNLERARRWLAGGPAPRKRTARSFALSAARSHLFNVVLAERVAEGSWNTMIAGDVARLDGSNSQFPVPDVDDEIRRRTAAADLHPSGPLWGKGDPGTTGLARALEDRVAGAETELCHGLEAETRMDRRSLRVCPGELTWDIGAASLELVFSLPAGSYATVVLEALLNIDDSGQSGRVSS